MTWNHRVVYSPKDKLFTIREVFYTPEGKPSLWDESADEPMGETFSDLLIDCSRFIGAASKPVLCEETTGSGEWVLREMTVEEVYAIKGE